MASNAPSVDKYSEEGRLVIGRFAYDVFSHVLPVFGFPESKIPASNRPENTYTIPRFKMVSVAGVLPICLIMRDKWKQFFDSRYASTAFEGEDLSKYLKSIFEIECGKEQIDYKFKVSLCLHIDIAMFFDYKGMETDFDKLIQSWSALVMQFVPENEDILQTIEDTMNDHVENVLLYVEWICDFITDNALPYGNQNVSNEFHEYFTEMMGTPDKHKVDIYDVDIPTVQSRLGFIPHEIPSAYVAGSSTAHFSKGIMLPTTSALPGDRVSPEPPRIPESFRRKNLTEANMAEQLASGSDDGTQKSAGEETENSSGPEKVPQPSQGVKPKRKKRCKKNKKGR